MDQQLTDSTTKQWRKRLTGLQPISARVEHLEQTLKAELQGDSKLT